MDSRCSRRDTDDYQVSSSRCPGSISRTRTHADEPIPSEASESVVTLTDDELARLDEIAPGHATAGDRYAASGMSLLNH